MGDAKVQHQRHRSRRIREVVSQLDVPTLLPPASNHLLCFHFVCCEEKVSELINHPVVTLLVTRVVGTSTEMIVKSVYLNFFQPQVTGGFSAMTGIWTPMVVAKKVCQRLADQSSSLR